MVIVHAAWSRRFGLCLWAEHDRARRRTGADGHPFACGSARLRTALAHSGADPGDGARAVELRLLLPSRAGAPLPSPELLRGRRPGPGRPALRPWQAPALALTPVAAVELVAFRPPRPGLELGLGTSFSFLREVGLFALDLVARGRVVPVLEPAPGFRPRSSPGGAEGGLRAR